MKSVCSELVIERFDGGYRVNRGFNNALHWLRNTCVFTDKPALESNMAIGLCGLFGGFLRLQSKHFSHVEKLRGDPNYKHKGLEFEPDWPCHGLAQMVSGLTQKLAQPVFEEYWTAQGVLPMEKKTRSSVMLPTEEVKDTGEPTPPSSPQVAKVKEFLKENPVEKSASEADDSDFEENEGSGTSSSSSQSVSSSDESEEEDKQPVKSKKKIDKSQKEKKPDEKSAKRCVCHWLITPSFRTVSHSHVFVRTDT